MRLETSIANVINKKEEAHKLRLQIKDINEAMKKGKQEILFLMRELEIQKADTATHSVSVTSTKKKETIGPKTLSEHLAKHMEAGEARALSEKVLESREVHEQEHLRVSKKKR